MDRALGREQTDLLNHMRQKIEAIEKDILDLKEMGKGIPVIEKNARCILSFTHVLRFGISDLAEALDGQGD